MTSCLEGLTVALALKQLRCIKMGVQFYDAGNDGASSSAAAEIDKPLDLSDAIANEAAELRERSNDIFTFHKTHVNGLLYVSMAASAGEPLHVCCCESVTALWQSSWGRRTWWVACHANQIVPGLICTAYAS